MSTAPKARSVVIVGAGQAGVTAAVTLRENGWEGSVTLVGGEKGTPYQRPGLSKGYLAGTEGDDDLLLRSPESLLRDGIEYRSGVTVDAIDRDGKTVLLSSGDELSYDALIFATGSQPRRLPIHGFGLAGVHTLRTRDDSALLKGHLGQGRSLLVAGGGFLGLEVAATAAQAGCEVTVLEVAPALLQRVVGTSAASRLALFHEAHGVRILYGVGVESLTGGERVEGAVLTDGTTVSAEAVFVAVGASPSTEIAQRAGLEVADGILVDEHLRTSDSAIFAIGDCARFPSVHAESVVRLESVQNAVDQARHVAATLTGQSLTVYNSVPWFWSHQYDQNLQIAGIATPADSEIALMPTKATGLAVARVRAGQIVAVETVNDPRVHLKARRLLSAGAVDIARIEEIAPLARSSSRPETRRGSTVVV